MDTPVEYVLKQHDKYSHVYENDVVAFNKDRMKGYIKGDDGRWNEVPVKVHAEPKEGDTLRVVRSTIQGVLTITLEPSEHLLPELDQNGARKKDRNKSSKPATWRATDGRARIKQPGKNGRVIEKTVYKIDKTGELRVIKMVERGGMKKRTYVKF